MRSCRQRRAGSLRCRHLGSSSSRFCKCFSWQPASLTHRQGCIQLASCCIHRPLACAWRCGGSCHNCHRGGVAAGCCLHCHARQNTGHGLSAWSAIGRRCQHVCWLLLVQRCGWRIRGRAASNLLALTAMLPARLLPCSLAVTCAALIAAGAPHCTAAAAAACTCRPCVQAISSCKLCADTSARSAGSLLLSSSEHASAVLGWHCRRCGQLWLICRRPCRTLLLHALSRPSWPIAGGRCRCLATLAASPVCTAGGIVPANQLVLRKGCLAAGKRRPAGIGSPD